MGVLDISPGGGYGPAPHTLTLFKTNIADFPALFKTEFRFSIPCLRHLLRNQWKFNVPGACFSKVPKLFGRISGDIILFVSSKRGRLEARNFAVIFIFIPSTTCEKISFTE